MNRKIILLHAAWCGPCRHLIRSLLPVVEQACPGQVETVDVSDDPQNLIRKYKIKRVPTFLLVDDENVTVLSRNPGRDYLIEWLRGDKDGSD